MNLENFFKSLKSNNLYLNIDYSVLKGLQYLCIGGSNLYGTNEAGSDYDIYGYSISSYEDIFPYSSGYIYKLDKQPEVFTTFQSQHNVL